MAAALLGAQRCAQLCAASKQGNAGVVQHLLGQNTDPGTGRAVNGDTALIAASRKGHLDVVGLLLSNGAHVNQSKDSGATALLVASQEGHADVVRLLLAHNSDPNIATTSKGATALYQASQQGHVEVALLLLESNADPNKARTDTNGQTVLYIAARKGHVEVARLLLGHGAEPNIGKTSTGATALHTAALHGQTEVAHLLLGHGADPCRETTDRHGATALQLASQEGHVEMARLLLKYTHPDTGSKDGTFPLYMASRQGHMEIVRLLLEHSADPNRVRSARKPGSTALHVASARGHVGVARLLPVYGAALGLLDDDGRSAQMFATRRGHDELAQWLTAVAHHAPVQIAVACRLHAEARVALRTGALGDPTMCTQKEVVHAATGTGLWGADNEMPPVCRATTRLARDAMACWSPQRHWLFHDGCREAIHAVLLVQERLGRREGVHPDARLPYLPVELWFYICAMLLRRDWRPNLRLLH